MRCYIIGLRAHHSILGSHRSTGVHNHHSDSLLQKLKLLLCSQLDTSLILRAVGPIIHIVFELAFLFEFSSHLIEDVSLAIASASGFDTLAIADLKIDSFEISI